MSAYQITPSIFSSAVIYFDSGASFCPGAYTLTYVGGAYRYGVPTEFGWTVNGNVDIVNPTEPLGLAAGFYVVLPGPTYIQAPGNTTEYASQAACEAGNAGLSITFNHAGGAIGMVLSDQPMDDNIAGSPSPTFTLAAASTYIGGTSASPTVVPNVLSQTPVNWNSGANMPAGLYYVEYAGGAYSYAGGIGTSWSGSAVVSDLGGAPLSITNISAGSPTVITTASAHGFTTGQTVVLTGVVPAPGIDGPWTITVLSSTTFSLNGSPGGSYTLNTAAVDGGNSTQFGPPWLTQYVSEATVEALSTGSGGPLAPVPYCHVGGKPIGAYIVDSLYTESPANSEGTTPFTLRLVGPSPVVTLSYSGGAVDAGDSAVLSYTTNGGSAVLTPGNIPLTGSGTVTVNPTSTTTYTLTLTTDGFTPVTASATVPVNPPGQPRDLTATGQCGGTISLSWGAALYVSGYTVQRSTDGVTWSTIGTTSGATTYTDTPPIAGSTYFYQVLGTSGGVSGTPSNTASAASILGAPTPSISVVARTRHAIVSWSAPPAGNYGTLTVNVYRGTSSGGETLLKSGLPTSLAQYWDTDLVDGTTYYYRLTFSGPCGEGAQSAEASVTAACGQNVGTASAPPTTASTVSAGVSTDYVVVSGPTTPSTASTPPSTRSIASTVASTNYETSAVPASTGVASAIPATVTAGVPAPLSTGVLSGQPASTAVASTPPSTGYTSSLPPSTGYDPDGCPG